MQISTNIIPYIKNNTSMQAPLLSLKEQLLGHWAKGELKTLKL